MAFIDSKKEIGVEVQNIEVKDWVYSRRITSGNRTNNDPRSAKSPDFAVLCFVSPTRFLLFAAQAIYLCSGIGATNNLKMQHQYHDHQIVY